MRPALALVAALALPAVPTLAAQQPEPPSTGGFAALAHETRALGQHLRVLVVGAHPDDEDTELLTLVSRGHGGEAAYLSLNRGEGGQNLIGAELGEALGIVRTEELLAARRLDGARQYFTRAYDFGYSRSLDDTWARWPRDSVLKDVVRIVRKFRPHIIVSIFTGTPRDGHGQHQAAGWAAREAFRVAGDSSRFPELAADEGFAPWQPLKLYRSTRFDSAATTLSLAGGALDRATGRTFHQLAMASRSLHRSQDMGQLQRIGPSPIELALLEDRTGGGIPFLAGLDTTLTGVIGADAARRYALLVERIRGGAGEGRAAAMREAAALLASADTLHPAVADQRRHLARAHAIHAGLLLDLLVSDAAVPPGSGVDLQLAIANAGDAPVTIGAVTLDVPDGAVVVGASALPGPGSVAAGALRVDRLTVTLAEATRLSVPYFLALPRTGDLYQWPEWARAFWGDAFEPPPITARVAIEGIAEPVGVTAVHRRNDQALGEQRSPLAIVPAVGVEVDRDTVVVAAGRAGQLALLVTLTNGTAGPVEGTLTLEVPAGWPAVEPQPFRLERPDQREGFPFELRLPATLAEGRYAVTAVATTAEGRHAAGLAQVQYPHIRTRTIEHPATVTMTVAPFAWPELARVGYIRGASDRVPEALAAAGLPVELLDSTALERADLGAYDAIIVGPRAYETDPALVEHNARLLAYAERGGLLVVQYQQYQFVQGQFAPRALTIAQPHGRITDETAPVRPLGPHAVLEAPNRIAPSDWEGWVQERGLYFADTWDDAYRPVLEMRDPGQPPLQGGLLVAAHGRGTYVYTGIAFFRQLPAGVPGAVRLFANILGLAGGSQP